jgi:hypothetical protein
MADLLTPIQTGISLPVYSTIAGVVPTDPAKSSLALLAIGGADVPARGDFTQMVRWQPGSAPNFGSGRWFSDWVPLIGFPLVSGVAPPTINTTNTSDLVYAVRFQILQWAFWDSLGLTPQFTGIVRLAGTSPQGARSGFLYSTANDNDSDFGAAVFTDSGGTGNISSAGHVINLTGGSPAGIGVWEDLPAAVVAAGVKTYLLVGVSLATTNNTLNATMKDLGCWTRWASK